MSSILVITDKIGNVLGVWTDDNNSLSSIYPYDKEIHDKYNEYILEYNKELLDSPQKYQIRDGILSLRAPSENELLEKIREHRNYLLQQSDFTQLVDSPLTESQKEKWRVYRQELRDFPQTCDIFNPIWPISPE